MKSIISYISVVLLLVVTSLSANAQAFQKGNINIDLDLGMGIYATQTSWTLGVGPFTQSGSDADGTVGTVFRLGGEYGISNKFGLGLKFGSSNYLIAEEDKDTIQSVKSTDFSINFNFHLLNAEKNDLFLTLELGGASAKWLWHEDKTFLSSAKGSGSYVALGLTDRIFFNDNVGILFSFKYAGFNYSNITAELSSIGKDLASALSFLGTPSWSFDSIRLNGVYLGTGLALKF